jgi:hypothetical protein
VLKIQTSPNIFIFMFVNKKHKILLVVYQWDNNQMTISQIFFKYRERGLKGAKTLRSGQWGHEKGLGQKPHPKSTVAKNQSDHTSIKSIVP